MSSGEKSGRVGKIFTCLGLIIVSVFAGILAIPGASGSPLIYIHIVYVYVVPLILVASGFIFAMGEEKYHKYARWGLIAGYVFVGLPFVLSIIVSKLNV
jgi:ABC-type spermidine/putrescine transport system permease subunit II